MMHRHNNTTTSQPSSPISINLHFVAYIFIIISVLTRKFSVCTLAHYAHKDLGVYNISSCFFYFVYGKEFYGIFGTASDLATLKRINVCITAFSYQRLIFGTFGTRRRPGRDLTGIGYPEGVDPTTPRLLPTATIRLSFEILFYMFKFFLVYTLIA